MYVYKIRNTCMYMYVHEQQWKGIESQNKQCTTQLHGKAKCPSITCIYRNSSTQYVHACTCTLYMYMYYVMTNYSAESLSWYSRARVKQSCRPLSSQRLFMDPNQLWRELYLIQCVSHCQHRLSVTLEGERGRGRGRGREGGRRRGRERERRGRGREGEGGRRE